MPKSGLNVALKGLDDIFSTEESRQEEQREQVQQIPVSELFPFKNHPFKVLDDDSMTRTVESISQFGVLAPLIARPRPEGGYEIISGHRRKHAAELANLDTVPVIVRNMKLNEQIRGWTNYHQSVCASDAFAHLDYVLYELLWRWAKRRHPKKNKWWISTRYWHRVGNRNWVFSTENKELIRVDSTAIVRHPKIKATANPFLDEAYFQKRKFDKGMHRLTGKFKTIWKKQNGLCYHCGMPMDVTEEREIFYLAPKAKTGVEDVRNMRYVHCACQRIYAENRLKK